MPGLPGGNWMHKFLREKIDGRRFFRFLVNPKCIIWLNDDQIYVIPVNTMSSDIHHHYFILLFVDNDGILSHYICRFETTLLFIIHNIQQPPLLREPPVLTVYKID